MIEAYVLIRTEPGTIRDVYQRLREVQARRPELTSVRVVTGPYDVIAHIEAADHNQMGQLVALDIHGPGVAETMTCIAIDLA